MERFLPDRDATIELGRELALLLSAGQVVLLSGDLGSGKTTLVRGLLMQLGVKEPVRSPTFNLVQVFETEPPVMHADLYRVETAAGIGLEDYLETHLCLIEWPDRLGDLVRVGDCWRVEITFESQGRRARICLPSQDS